MKIKVGVIFGGRSVEHEISIITAVQAMEFMDKNKYEIIPIYIAKDQVWYTGKLLMEMDVYRHFDDLKKYAKQVCLTKKDGEFVLQTTKGLFKRTVETLDLAFPIVHGKGAEDGSLAGYLETIGIPYVGSGILGSALGQDKVILKQVLEVNGIKTPDYVWFYDYEYFANEDDIITKVGKLNYPVIVKPANLGSTIGIHVAHDEEQLKEAIKQAIDYDKKILVEKMVPNLQEVNCAILGNYEYQETSFIAEMLTDNELLTFDDKYMSGSKKTGRKVAGKMSNSAFTVPAKLDKDIEENVYELAKKTCKVLNLAGVARIDFLIDKKTHEVFVNEPNTIPGCLSFFLFDPKGKNYTNLLDEMIDYAIKDYKGSLKKISSFDSNVLSTFKNGTKGKIVK